MCSSKLESIVIIFSLTIVLLEMDFGKFLEFIYFSSFTISMNFPDQLVTNMCEPVLKD